MQQILNLIAKEMNWDTAFLKFLCAFILFWLK